MKLLADIDIKNIPLQVKSAIIYLLDTPRFIVEHKLWRGYFSNIWIFGISLLASYLFTTAIYADIKEMITHEKEEEVIAQNAASDRNIAELKILMASTQVDSLREEYENEVNDLEQIKKDRLSSLHQPLFSGFLKLILLLILEIVIYHFSVKTNNILKGQKGTIEMKDFVEAEIRMFKVMLRNAVLGWIAWLILKVIFSVLGLSFLHDSAYYIITAFYLGFAFIDNYLELYNISISSSAVIVRSHIGGALVIGLISSALLLVPLIGPLFIPILCSIAATRYADQFQIENHPSAVQAV